MEVESVEYRTIPTAPPNAEAYRLSKINEIQQFLQSELCVREGLYKKYKKGLNGIQIFECACSGFGIGATASSLALLTSDVGAAIVTGLQGVRIAAGVLGGIGKLTGRKVNLKMRKHDEIKVLAQAKLSTITEKASTAYDDGYISDSEFKGIITEQRQYLSMKNEIQTQMRKAAAAGTEGEEKQIMEDALHNM